MHTCIHYHYLKYTSFLATVSASRRYTFYDWISRDTAVGRIIQRNLIHYRQYVEARPCVTGGLFSIDNAPYVTLTALDRGHGMIQPKRTGFVQRHAPASRRVQISVPLICGRFVFILPLTLPL